MSLTRVEQVSETSAPQGDSPPEAFALDLFHPLERQRLIVTFTNLGLEPDEIREAVAPLIPLIEDASLDNRTQPESPLLGFAEKALRDAFVAKTGMSVPDVMDEMIREANMKGRQERLARNASSPEPQRKRSVLFRLRARDHGARA